MDIRDPHLRPGRVWNVGCPDSSVIYRLGPNGSMQKKPVCAECMSRGQHCFDHCPDIDDCLLIEECDACDSCKFTDICDADRYPNEDDLPEVDYLKLKDAQEALDNANVPEDERVLGQTVETLTYPWDNTSSLCFQLKEYRIQRIDNGLICTYGLNGTEHQRFFPDTKSLSRFIDKHTEGS